MISIATLLYSIHNMEEIYQELSDNYMKYLSEKNPFAVVDASNEIFTEKTLREYIVKNNINLARILLNPNISIDFMKELISIHKDKFEINVREISYNKSVTMDIIEKHPELPWMYSSISYNPNITLEFLKKNKYKNWNWTALSSNPGITVEILNEFSDKKWCLYNLYQNKSLIHVKTNFGMFKNMFDKYIFKNVSDMTVDEIKIYDEIKIFDKMKNVHFNLKIKALENMFDYMFNYDLEDLIYHPDLTYTFLEKYSLVERYEKEYPDLDRNGYTTDVEKFNHKYKYFKIHQLKMRNVISEFYEVLMHPDNILKAINLGFESEL